MDLVDITQVALVATVTLVLGRIGWSFARLIDRRASRQPALPDDAAERIRALEDEQQAMRQELSELQERQDFTERALLREQPPKRDHAVPERIATPQ